MSASAKRPSVDRAALRAELVALAAHLATLDHGNLSEAPAAVLLLWACGLGHPHNPVAALLAQVRQELAVLGELLGARPPSDGALAFVSPIALSDLLASVTRRLRVAEAFAVRLASEKEST